MSENWPNLTVAVVVQRPSTDTRDSTPPRHVGTCIVNLTARHGMARYGTARHGTARRCVAQRNSGTTAAIQERPAHTEIVNIPLPESLTAKPRVHIDLGHCVLLFGDGAAAWKLWHGSRQKRSDYSRIMIRFPFRSFPFQSRNFVASYWRADR